MDTIFGPLIEGQAYAHIKEAIISLRLQPGQRLRTADIAESIEVSRTPVREALGRLEQEGLVRRAEGWGYVVATMTARDILNLYSVRELLEVEAAVEAIPNLDATAMKQLVDINRQAEKLYSDGRYDAFLTQNRKLYIALATMSGNTLLQQMLGMIHDRVRWVGFMIVRMHRGRAQELLLENRDIVAALKSRKRQAVESAVRTHIRKGRDHVLRLFDGSA